MKVIRGVNPDYADYDEIDPDAMDAEDLYMQGLITFEELSYLVGPEVAVMMRSHRFGEDDDDDDDYINDLLDDIKELD